MEIIIHGKPNAGSYMQTDGLDNDLAKNITQGFFEQGGQMHDLGETLIVDTRLWKGSWHGVYTFTPGVNVIDTAGRKSYFCISIVVLGKYCLYTSGVYDMLRSAFNDTVVGTYLTKNGQYIVGDLGDISLFNNVVAKINSLYTNMEEDFGGDFRQNFDAQKELGECTQYSLLDCDSRAFIESLMSTGRILVKDDRSIAKDTMLKNTDKYVQRLKEVQNEVDRQKEEITRLMESIGSLNNDKSASGQKLHDMEKKLQSAEAARTTAEQSRDEMKKTLDGIAEMLSARKDGTSNKDKPTPHKPAHNGKPGILQMVNTGLLALILLLSLANLKGCFGLIEKAVERMNPTQNNKDIPCGIQIYQDDIPVKNLTEINFKKNVTVKAEQHDGYRFYYNNLNANEGRN